MEHDETHSRRRRMLDFAELEAWLRELPWWREWVQDIGGAVTGGGDITGIRGGGGRPGSPTEREALNRSVLRTKVDLLDAWVGYLQDDDTVLYQGRLPKLPVELARLIHCRYMAKNATMGLPVGACCQELHLSRVTFYKQRERALSLLVSAIYNSGIQIGQPYADCREEAVPVSARAGARAQSRRLDKEIEAAQEEADACIRRARNDAGNIDFWENKATMWREKAEELQRQRDDPPSGRRAQRR